jgi:hypothetical protein
MVTTTQRTSHAVTDSYTDIVTSIPGAAATPGFIRHLGGADVEIVMGGAGAPASTVRGIPLSQGEEEACEADHIWVKCRTGLSAVIGFDTSVTAPAAATLDRELAVTTYVVKTAFTGASVGDTITATQVIDVSGTPSSVATIWRNQTTAADLAGAPSAANLTLIGAGGLSDAQLRAAAVPVSIAAELEVKNDSGSPLAVAKGQQAVADCVISNGQSLSAAVDLGVARLVGLSIPATFEPATVTFQASYDGATFNNVYDSSGVEKTIAVGASRRVILSPADFYGVRYIKLRGGTAASPTVVAADRTVKLIAEA